VYASVADMRAEGVTEFEANDARLSDTIDEVTRLLDRVCGWWFEPRTAELMLSGRGSRFLELPVPPIAITSIEVNDSPFSVAAEDCKIVGNLCDGPPRIVKHSSLFSRGRNNVIISGTFGFVERSATNAPQVPRAIRRACILLVVERFPQAASAEAASKRDQWRVIEERTRDQAIVMAERKETASSLTGNPDADKLLAAYRRPPQFGSV
jgi:hypothetical protein